jgi:hypothetical protein
VRDGNPPTEKQSLLVVVVGYRTASRHITLQFDFEGRDIVAGQLLLFDESRRMINVRKRQGGNAQALVQHRVLFRDGNIHKNGIRKLLGQVIKVWRDSLTSLRMAEGYECRNVEILLVRERCRAE